MSYLIDSDWVVEHLKGYRAAVLLISRLAQFGIAISLVTYAEVYEGILYGRDIEQNRRVFQQFIRGVRVLPVNRTVLRRFALIRGELRQQRRQVQHRSLDLLIAATALTYDLDLVTRNTRDFADVPGLRLYAGR